MLSVFPYPTVLSQHLSTGKVSIACCFHSLFSCGRRRLRVQASVGCARPAAALRQCEDGSDTSMIATTNRFRCVRVRCMCLLFGRDGFESGAIFRRFDTYSANSRFRSGIFGVSGPLQPVAVPIHDQKVRPVAVSLHSLCVG